MKKEGLWQITLVKNVQNTNIDTVVVKKSSPELLKSEQPPTEQMLSAYEFKTQPELIRYYHAVTGFLKRQPGQPQSNTSKLLLGLVCA